MTCSLWPLIKKGSMESMRDHEELLLQLFSPTTFLGFQFDNNLIGKFKTLKAFNL